MNCSDLNKKNKEQMERSCRIKEHFEWEDNEIFNILLGDLPTFSSHSNNIDIREKEIQLLKIYNSYEFPLKNSEMFLSEIDNWVKEIQKTEPYRNTYLVENISKAIKIHKFCLINGEGGIGKSYFIKMLEDKLETQGIKHLCIYGKFEKDLSNVNFDEIINLSNEEVFVFIIDAINEMSSIAQIELIEKLEKFKKIDNIRIIVSYRNNTLDNSVEKQYQELSEYIYRFPGVSYESVLDSLNKLPIFDVYKYENILFSHNPLHLSMLADILADNNLENEVRNNIASVTYILEQYIKSSLSRAHWQKTKDLAKIMYNAKDKKVEKSVILKQIIDAEKYLEDMISKGFITCYSHENNLLYQFTTDSIADFLIARALTDELDKNDTNDENNVLLIKKVIESFYIDEEVVLAIFDKFKNDYERIKNILIKAELMDVVGFDTLVKVNFKKDDIKDFLKVFTPNYKDELLLYFGGYTDKPFNCVNYLNEYYFKEEKLQKVELSKTLSGRFLNKISTRLKNLLYFININRNKNRRMEEAFYFSIWCCASPNDDIRICAMKLLHDILCIDDKYVNTLVTTYDKVSDYYIQSAIIQVLEIVNPVSNIKVNSLFNTLKNDSNFLYAESLKRIERFFNQEKCILWDKKNLYVYDSDAYIPDEIHEVLWDVDIYDKLLVPFRYWGRDSVDLMYRFIEGDKNIIYRYNERLSAIFTCIKENGACCGRISFKKESQKIIPIETSVAELHKISFIVSLGNVLKNIMADYQISHDNKNIQYHNFSSSVYRKCIIIAMNIFYGSMMCNYYTDEFNIEENIIGYEAYNPLQREEMVYLATPIQTYQLEVEKMNDIVVGKINLPEVKSVEWLKDSVLAEENLKRIIEPFSCSKHSWQLLAGRLAIHQKDDKNNKIWEDVYDIWCCTSTNASITGGRNDREYTIELEDYDGSLNEYKNVVKSNYLCKRVNSIKYDSEAFDNTTFVLPPAEIINEFNLKFDYVECSWKNDKDENVIYCNNNKKSYYNDFACSTVYIRKDLLDVYQSKKSLKYFAYQERYLPNTGYAVESQYHYEMENGKVIKKFPNKYNSLPKEEINPLCTNCPLGLNDRFTEGPLHKFLKSLKYT